MGFEGTNIRKPEKFQMQECKVSELSVGVFVEDQGILKEIRNVIPEPDGGIRILLNGGNPRHYSSDEVNETISVAV